MNARQLEKLVFSKGWYIDRMHGSHKIYKHDKIQGLLVIPHHGSKDIPKGTLMSIFKKAGLKIKR